MLRHPGSLCASGLPLRSQGFPLSLATLAHRMGEGLGVRAMGVERVGVRGNRATFASTPELFPRTVKLNESPVKAGGFSGEIGGLKTLALNQGCRR